MFLLFSFEIAAGYGVIMYFNHLFCAYFFNINNNNQMRKFLPLILVGILIAIGISTACSEISQKKKWLND